MHDNVPSPQWTTLAHAVRWIYDFTPCLSPEDAYALDDHPCVIVRDFKDARDKLLLAIRHKTVLLECQDFGLWSARTHRYLHNVPFRSEIAFSELDISLMSCRVDLEQESRSFGEVNLDAIPEELLVSSCIAWDENTIYTHESEDWQFQCYNLRLSVSDLYREFPSPPPEVPIPNREFAPQERRSAMKMILAMAIARYRYDPDAKTSETTSKIQGDIERLGLSIDSKTIRKFLKEASQLLPPEG